MAFLQQALPILLTVSLGLLIVAAGVASSRGDFVYVLQRPRLLAKAVLAIHILPLLVAMIVIALIPITHAARAGIILMAISPVPPLVPGKALKFGGTAGYVYGLQLAAALVAIVSVPLLGSLTARFYGVDAQFPPAVVTRNIFVGLVVPLAIGLAIGRWLFPNATPGVPRTIGIVANVLLVIAFVPILVGSWPLMAALIGDGTVVAMAVVVTLALIGGHLLGGPDRQDRSTLAFASAMRHPGIAMALASANHSDKAVAAAVLLFMLVGVVALVPYQLFLKHNAASPA